MSHSLLDLFKIPTVLSRSKKSASVIAFRAGMSSHEASKRKIKEVYPVIKAMLAEKKGYRAIAEATELSPATITKYISMFEELKELSKARGEKRGGDRTKSCK